MHVMYSRAYSCGLANSIMQAQCSSVSYKNYTHAVVALCAHACNFYRKSGIYDLAKLVVSSKNAYFRSSALNVSLCTVGCIFKLGMHAL